MRTKIGKRVGPVPIALVAVLALAAFISAGLWFVPGNGQTAEAQGYADDVPEACSPLGNEVAADFTADPVTNLDTPVADQCVASGDTVTISLPTAGTTHRFFTDGKITGGQDVRYYAPDNPIAAGTIANVADGYEVPPDASAALSYIEVSEDSVLPKTLTISRNGKNPVKLYRYATNTGLNLTLTGAVDSRDFKLADADDTDTIYFVSAPLGKPDKDESSIAVADVANTSAGTKVSGGTSGVVTASFADNEQLIKLSNYTYETAANEALPAGEVNHTAGTIILRPKANDQELFHTLTPGTEITITEGSGTSAVKLSGRIRTNAIAPAAPATDPPTVRGLTLTIPTPSPAPAFTDGASVSISVMLSRTLDDGNVTFSVEGGDGVKFKSGLFEGTEVTLTAKAAMQTDSTKADYAGLKVVGLPTSTTTPYKVTLKAKYVGASGELEEKDDTTLVHEGSPASITVTAYSCKDTCATEQADHEDDDTADLKKLTVVAPGERFLVVASVMDSAENPLADRTVSLTQTSPAAATASDRGITADDGETNAKGIAYLVATVGAASVAKMDDYTLSVETNGLSADVMTAVTGKASMIELTCSPDPIPVTSGETNCDVTLTDDNGNMPSGLTGTVQVSVRNKGATILADDGSKANVTDKGTASFTIVLDEDAVEGRSYTINVQYKVGDTTLRDSTTVVYGGMPAMPTGVMATAQSDAEIWVEWNAVSGAASYMLERGTMDDAGAKSWTTVAAMATGTSYMDSGLTAETAYYYRVSATNAAGSSDPTDGTATATTQAVPSMDLMAPTNVAALSLKAGEVGVTWMPGQYALGHMVVLFEAGEDMIVTTLAAGATADAATLTDVPAGAYDAVVVSFRSSTEFKLSESAPVTVK